MYKTLLVTLTASALSTGAVATAPAVRKEPLDAATLSAIRRTADIAEDYRQQR